ncbi:aldehyde dehydrogenase family protein [Amycolatopsis acidicola]|uniref:Aldehyde dehydrogenase family protein n=1 Tax=Amycolatopsis acidicola TaxID=2596893 RepID=A0A5N0UU16_9PSEU|nr:aldehyde dehydrogenase family protein [Amycolatopsis acidicola]KAA9151862.1 aldehyde dehydrogenase family protein [Amycolatopsis acidicola]
MTDTRARNDLQGVAANPLWTNGVWSPAEGAAIAVVDPSSEQILAEVRGASAAQVEAVCAAAADAQWEWARTAPSVRAKALRDMAAVLRAHAEPLADIIMRESGKTAETSAMEVEVSAMFLETNAEWALRIEGEILPSDSPGEQIQLVREPLGVVAAICPWNWPLATAARKIGPALVTGNTVVVKPSEVTPLATILALRLIDEALDLPAGVLGLVTGAGDVGKALVASPLTDMVTFTGHRDTGKRIMAAASGTLTRVALELGGKAAAIVLADADLDVAVPALVTARFVNAGEQCGCAERIFVARPILDEFVRRYVEAVSRLKVGDPRLNLDFGPLVNASHWDKVSGAVRKAVDEGATVALGGGRPEGTEFDSGFWFAPTVLTGVTPEMSIAKEETFGPVVPVLPIDSFDEGIALANSSRYGLAGYLYTTSYAHAMRGARDLNVGELFINRTVGEAMHAHHGGHKESGYGGEDGKHGMLKYTQLKVVYHNW